MSKHESLQPNAARHHRQRQGGQRRPDRRVRRPLPDGEPRARARDGGGAEGDRGASSASASSTRSSFDKANRTSPVGQARHRARGVAAGLRRDPRDARPAGRHRRARGGAVRAAGAGRRRAADPGLPVPADRSADRRRQDRPRRQGQEGAVPGALGHEERRRQDRRLRQSQRAGHRARRLASATTRWSSTCARCRSWPRPAAR